MKKLALVAMVAILAVFGITACDGEDDDPPPKPSKTVDATVSFVSLTASWPATTLDFSPSADLPADVTYKLTDNKGHSWGPTRAGVQVPVTTYDTAGNVTFTQTFYLDGAEITGANSKRTVTVSVVTGFATNFGGIVGEDSGAVTLKK